MTVNSANENRNPNKTSFCSTQPDREQSMVLFAVHSKFPDYRMEPWSFHMLAEWESKLLE